MSTNNESPSASAAESAGDGSNSGVEDDCPICNLGGDLVPTPCGHKFHLPCLLRWNYTTARRGGQTTCPICRVALLASAAATTPRPATASVIVPPRTARTAMTFASAFNPVSISSAQPTGTAASSGAVGSNHPVLGNLLSAFNISVPSWNVSNVPMHSTGGNPQPSAADTDMDFDAEESLDTLIEFISEGNYGGMRDSIAADPRVVNIYCEDGTTPLHHCVARSDIQAVDIMIEARANTRVRSNFGVSPLHMACSVNNVVIAERLLARGACVDITDRVGDTPLHYAVRSCDVNMVNLLLSRSAMVDASNDRGESVLHTAAVGTLPVINTMLFQHRPVLDKLNYLGETALHVAVKHNNVDFAKKYIEQGTAFCRFRKNLCGLSPQDMAFMSGTVLMKNVFYEASLQDDSDEDEDSEGEHGDEEEEGSADPADVLMH